MVIKESLSISDVLSGISKNQKLVECNKAVIKKKDITLNKFKYLFESLLMLHSTGMSFFDCILLMSESEDNHELKTRLYFLKKIIEKGESISVAFEKSFPESEPIIVAFLKVHEKTGDMMAAIKDSLEYLKEKESLQQKLYQLMVYPLMTITVLILAIMYFFNVYLARIIQFLAGHYHSDIFQLIYNYRWIFNMFIIIGFLTAVWIIKKGKIYQILKYFGGKSIVNNMIFVFYTELFALYFFYLYKSGISLINSLGIIKSNPLFIQYQKEIFLMIEDIKNGLSLTESLQRIPFLSKRHIAIIRNGETSGKVTESIKAVYDESKNFRTNMIKYMAVLIQPLMTIMIGIIIAIICYVFYKTMFTFTTSIYF